MNNAPNCAPVATNTPERIERLAFLKKAVGEFKTEDFGTPETGYTLTVDFGRAPRNGKPDTFAADDPMFAGKYLFGVILANLPTIRKVIAAMPDERQLTDILARCDACRTLTDIGLPEAMRDSLYNEAPLIRNRLTLMRLIRNLKV